MLKLKNIQIKSFDSRIHNDIYEGKKPDFNKKRKTEMKTVTKER